MFLNKKIREARLENKMTQKELANELSKLDKKISNTAIANWESGLTSPDVDTLELICKILNKDGNYFFDITNNDNNYINIISKKYGSGSIELLEDFIKLNESGKQKANENIKDLTKISEYTIKKTKSQNA